MQIIRKEVLISNIIESAQSSRSLTWASVPVKRWARRGCGNSWTRPSSPWLMGRITASTGEKLCCRTDRLRLLLVGPPFSSSCQGQLRIMLSFTLSLLPLCGAPAPLNLTQSKHRLPYSSLSAALFRRFCTSLCVTAMMCVHNYTHPFMSCPYYRACLLLYCHGLVWISLLKYIKLADDLHGFPMSARVSR